ncbi:MAG: hypothetical protein WBN66_03675 [Smithella sp.]
MKRIRVRTKISQLKRQPIGIETLERVMRWPSCADKIKGKFVLIFSREHLAYWRPNAAGYTDCKEMAGVWPFADAFKRTRHCGPEKMIEFHF